MGMSAGVMRMARRICSESSMSMKRRNGMPSRLRVSWRWIIVMTREPRRFSKARRSARRRRSRLRRSKAGTISAAATSTTMRIRMTVIMVETCPFAA